MKKETKHLFILSTVIVVFVLGFSAYHVHKITTYESHNILNHKGGYHAKF